MKRTAVILAAVIALGSLSACGSTAGQGSSQAMEVLTMDPNGGPGRTEEEDIFSYASGSEVRASFVPRAAGDADNTFQKTNNTTVRPTSAPTPAVTTPAVTTPAVTTPTPTPTKTPTSTPTETPTPTPLKEHEHEWVEETVVDSEAWDEEQLTIPAWTEEVVTPGEPYTVHHEAVTETVTEYVCNLCGETRGSAEEMEAHRAEAHAEAEDFGFTPSERVVEVEPAWDETVTPEGETTIIEHPAVYETVHHPAVTHTVKHCRICGETVEVGEDDMSE